MQPNTLAHLTTGTVGDRLDVRPLSPVNNVIDRRVVNSVCASEFSLSCSVLVPRPANLSHGVFVESRKIVITPALVFRRPLLSFRNPFPVIRQRLRGMPIPKSMSVLLDHICHIVLWGSQKEMTGIYTPRVIASMADKKPARSNPVMCPVHESVYSYFFVVNSNSRVIRSCERSFPNLTSVGNYVNKTPNSLSFLSGEISKVRIAISHLFAPLQQILWLEPCAV